MSEIIQQVATALVLSYQFTSYHLHVRPQPLGKVKEVNQRFNKILANFCQDSLETWPKKAFLMALFSDRMAFPVAMK